MPTLGIDIGGSSIKAALLDADGFTFEATSPRYARPTREELLDELRSLLRDAPAGITAIGLCVPGLMNAARTAIEKSVNVPGLVGTPFNALVREALPHTGSAPVTPTSDAHAAAFDLWHSEHPRPSGRLLALSLGTGVGACVLDDGVPLHVSGTSPGHIGQLDVSIDDHPPVGADGGRGSLEAYIGLPALIARYGRNAEIAITGLAADTPPLLALARAIRICHAIYRPHHVRLLGGVGIRIAHAVPALQEQIAHELTGVAREGWTLTSGASEYHAARGAARLASQNRDV